MSVLSGFKKYIHHTTDSNGNHIKQSFWTSSDTVDGKITESSSRTNLNDGETLTVSLGKIKKWFTDLGTSAFKNTTNNYDPSGTDPVTGQAIAAALGTLPDPMVLRGTLGASADNPTITALPVDGSARYGDTYKVITSGTYVGVSAKVGDLFSCNGKTASANTWTLIPAGDDSIVIANPTGTATGNMEKVSIDGIIYAVKDANAVEKEPGKSLSTNDYTTAEKNKLAGIEAQANKTIIDADLENAGQAADAKEVGDRFTNIDSSFWNIMNSIADLYDESSRYAIDDYCFYGDSEIALYRCTTAITTPENWNPSHWTFVRVCEDLSKLVDLSCLSVVDGALNITFEA